MHDLEHHRGPSPQDRLLFGINKVVILRRANQHFSWLLGQGYDAQAAMKLVGDHFQLRQRQRVAIVRSSCTDHDRDHRQKNQRLLSQLVGLPLAIDAQNCILTVEAALFNEVLLRGRDGALREFPLVEDDDHLAEKTIRAIGLLANLLASSQLKNVTWLLNQRLPGSSAIREELEGLVSAARWPWTVELVRDREHRLTQFNGTIATTDTSLLDQVNEWVDLPSVVVDRFLPGAWIVDFKEPTT